MACRELKSSVRKPGPWLLLQEERMASRAGGIESRQEVVVKMEAVEAAGELRLQ